MTKLAILALVACVAAGCVASYVPPPAVREWEPWPAPEPVARPQERAAGLSHSLLRLYQRKLRRPGIPGSGCPFQPSCSRFAIEVYGRYDPLTATALVFDRLFIRELTAGPGAYLLIRTGEGIYSYDPAR